MVDDEVQGFHDSDIDEQRCYWVRKMLYSKMMLKCCTFSRALQSQINGAIGRVVVSFDVNQHITILKLICKSINL